MRNNGAISALEAGDNVSTEARTGLYRERQPRWESLCALQQSDLSHVPEVCIDEAETGVRAHGVFERHLGTQSAPGALRATGRKLDRVGKPSIWPAPLATPNASQPQRCTNSASAPRNVEVFLPMLATKNTHGRGGCITRHLPHLGYVSPRPRLSARTTARHH